MIYLLKKAFFTFLLCVFVKPISAQNYFGWSEHVFMDTAKYHVEFIQKVFQENNAEEVQFKIERLVVENEKLAYQLDSLRNKFFGNKEECNTETTRIEQSDICAKRDYFLEECGRLAEKCIEIQTTIESSTTQCEECDRNRRNNCRELWESRNEYIDVYKRYYEKHTYAREKLTYHVKTCDEQLNNVVNVYSGYQQECSRLIDSYAAKKKLNEQKIDNYNNYLAELIRSSPLTFYEIQYYDTGEKYIEGFYSLKSRSYEGVAKEYFKNGNLKLTTTLIDGVQSGIVIEYNEDGSKKSECEYQNGAVVGECTYY